MEKMLESGRINIRQLVLLFITSRFILTLTFAPAVQDPSSNQDMWLATLVSVPLTILLAAPLLALAKKYPHRTIIEYTQIITGKFPGKVLGFLYIWFFLHEGAITLRQFGEFVAIVQLPRTPLVVLLVVFTIVAAYAAYSGLEVIGRANEIFFPVILGTFLLVFLLSVQNMDFHRLTPMFEEGIKPILSTGLSVSAKYIELAWVAMVIPFTSNSLKLGKGILLGILICGILFALAIMMITAVYGFPMIKVYTFPTLAVARLISIANFLERIEALIMISWVLGVMIKVTLFYYAFVLGSAQWLNLGDHRPLVLPAGIILVAMSDLLFSSTAELGGFAKPEISNPYTMVFILVIPLILLAVAALTAHIAHK